MSAISADITPFDGDVPDAHRLQRQIELATAQLLEQARPLCRAHRTMPPSPQIRFDLRGKTAGQVQWQGRRVVIRYNLDIARRHTERFIATTVPHEVAHLVTVACHGRVRPHGPEWRRVMGYFGIADPQRCHNFALDESRVRQQRRWPYRCDCRRHDLSTTRHKRAQAGRASYLCRHCGGALRPVTDAAT